MGANERQLAKALSADLDAAHRTGTTLASAAAEVNVAARDLRTVGSEPGLEGLAGEAAADSFALLARECTQLADDLGEVANAGARARLALDTAAADYQALPPDELSAGQRAQLTEAYATQGTVLVPGRGWLSPWAAEQAWLAQARAKREAEAAQALAVLNSRISEAGTAARSAANPDVGTGWEDLGGGQDAGTSAGATSSTPADPSGSTSGGGSRIGVPSGTGSSGTVPVVADPPPRVPNATPDGSTSGGGIGGGGSGGGASTGAGGSSGGGSGVGLPGGGATAGAGGALAGGAAVGGVALGAVGLGRGGLGLGGLAAAGGGAGASGGAGGIGGGARAAGGAGLAGGGRSAVIGTPGATGSAVLGTSATGGAAGGGTGAGQAGARGPMGPPMGGAGGAQGAAKGRRRGDGYLAPDVEIEEEATPVALGPAARAGSRDQVPVETPDLDIDDDEW